MRNYDFVEIGTCFYYTLVGVCSEAHVGLSIEPIFEYLQRVPDKPHVTKVAGAVVADDDLSPSGLSEVFYVDEALIDQHGLGQWFKGCNSLGRPHDFHTHYYPDPDVWHATEDKSELSTVDLLAKGLVTTKRVKSYTVTDLLATYAVSKIGLLKIDTEGYDCRLVASFLNHYADDFFGAPEKIMFESNSHSRSEEVHDIRQRLTDFGYKIKFNEHDTVAYKTDTLGWDGRDLLGPRGDLQ